MKQYFWLIIIVLIGGFLRFYNLASNPPALNSDEVAIGYNAYSILKTGRDEYGRACPLTFRSFDDYKMPVYVYMVTGSMAVFGKSDFAVRFPSAFFGTLTIVLTFFLVKELYKKKQLLPLLASVLLAISPWHLLFSRSGYEANVSVFFITLGALLFILGVKRGTYIIFSAVAFSLAVWTYHTARIFVPLLLLGLTAMYRKELWQKKIYTLIGFIVGGVVLFPIIQLTMSLEGQMRAMGVSSFSNPDDLKISISRIIFDTEHNLAPFSFFHNRRFEYATTFLRGYFSHFDLNYLFLDKAIERYRAPGVGLLYLFELPFLFIGIYQLVRELSKGSAILFWWVIMAPVAAAFTLQLPHPVRTLVFMPALQIISSIGVCQGILWMKKIWDGNKKTASFGLSSLMLCFLVLNVVYVLHQFFVHMPIENAKYWYAGRKEMVDKLEKYKPFYDRIIVSNKLDFPYVFFLYYGDVDPNEYLQQGGTKSGGFLEEGNTWGKYEFRSVSDIRSLTENILFVGQPGEEFKMSQVIDTVYYLDKTPVIVFFR